jgi:hypothetical protein
MVAKNPDGLGDTIGALRSTVSSHQGVITRKVKHTNKFLSKENPHQTTRLMGESLGQFLAGTTF